MDYIAKEALEITEKIVTARVANTTAPINEQGGHQVGKYFNAIYNDVLPIIKQIHETE